MSISFPKPLQSIVSFVLEHNWHRHPLFIPVATFMVLFIITMVTFVVTNGQPVTPSDSHTVILSYDKNKRTIPTRAATVGQLLEKAQVTLHEGDIVEPARDAKIEDDNFRINVYRAQPVLVMDGDRKTFAFSAASTPRAVVDQSGIKVYPEDVIQSKMTSGFLKDGGIGKTVMIERATPTHLNVYGTQLNVRTHAKTVQELLKEKNVKLEKDDIVQPALSTPLTQASQIFVTRSGTKIQTVEEPIAMQIEYVEDASLSFGSQAIRQAGSAGKKLVTYQIALTNDKETGRTVIQTVTVQDQVKQIVARGKAVSIPSDRSAIMAAAGLPQSDYPYADYIISRESGWCPTKLQGQYGSCPAYAPASIPSGSVGYGLCQSTPGTKMASAGADWQTSAVTQLKWCTSYASRYGGWKGAYDFWLSHHWW